MVRPTGIWTRILRWTAGLVAAVLIVLALLVGVARLLLPLAPEYQADIRRFAAATTGLDINFDRLSATWPIAGPEVRFYGVQVSTRDGGRKVLDARELWVGVSLLQVLAEGRVVPGRVTLRGARIRAERIAGGEVLINGVPLAELLPQPPGGRLPRLDVMAEGIRLTVADPQRLVPEATLAIAEFDLRLRPDGARFAGEFQPEGGLGRTLEIAGRLPAALLRTDGTSGPLPPREPWFVRASGTDLDLAQTLRLVLDEDWPLETGRGDLNIRADFRGAGLQGLDLELRSGGTRFREGATPGPRFDQLDLVTRWRRDGNAWSLDLERLVARQGEGPARVSRAQVRYESRGAGSASALAVRGEELYPGDVYPLVRALASAELRAGTLPDTLGGVVSGLEFDARWGGGEPTSWQARADLRGVGVVMPAPGMAVTGLTGQLTATEATGRLDLASTGMLLRFPTLFRKDIQLTSATGRLGWRAGPQGLQVVGDDLRLRAEGAQARGRFQVRFPPEGSPVVDITARAQADSARAALEWLPLQKFKPNVVEWLDRAVVAGAVPRADLTWQGPLRAFPYREGDGQFQVRFSVADGVLDYAPGWPRTEGLSAEVLVDRWTLVSTENRATLAGLAVANAEVRVPDLARDPTVAITVEQPVAAGALLNFLRRSPVSEMLGPVLANVTATGQLGSSLELSVPLARLRDTRVTGRFSMDRASLGLRGLEFGLTGLKGTLALDTTRLQAEGVTGRFLDEPVEIDLRPAESEEAGLSHVAVIRGRTPAAKLTAAFALPYRDKLTGETDWLAVAEIPDRQGTQPLRIRVSADLEDVTSTLPVPLAKAAGIPEPLDLELRLPERNLLEVQGRLQRGASWALRFETAADGTGWALERGNLRYGTPAAILPTRPGLAIGGRFRQLRFEDWFPGEAAGSGAGRSAGLREIAVAVEEFAVLGRLFRQVELTAERTREAWNIGVQSERAAGRITAPVDGGDNVPITAQLDRLWLVEDDPGARGSGEGEGSDPRRLPAVRAEVADFVLSDMKLGRLSAEVVQRGDGVAVEPLTFTGRGFRITGDALWIVVDGDPARQRSELRLNLASTNLAATLTALGYDPVMEGKRGDVALDAVWPGGPRKDFLAVASGRLTLSLTGGQFLAVEPGSGRILGLLSVAALPRRLGLDFRDVLEEGLAFDNVKGEFRLDGGTAITCNLGLEGPVADLGMVGRVGLADRSYDQIAVARPHVSDVLALGGAVVGGPVLGGAVLLISQIFRKPLSSLGENYYTVTGSWEKPVVTKVQRSEVDVTPFKDCERYLAEALRQIPPGVDTER